ncbi:F-box protein At3g07870 [Linum perenne]
MKRSRKEKAAARRKTLRTLKQRSASNHPQNNCTLPWDIVTEILKRLPTGRSIARLRSVCILWYKVLSDPTFIHSILSFNCTNPNSAAEDDKAQILVKGKIDDGENLTDYRFVYSLLSYNTFKPIATANQNPDLPCVPDKVRSCHFYDSPTAVDLGLDLSIVGCCDGIFCIADKLYGSASDIILWNPATSETMILPRSPSFDRRMDERATDRDRFFREPIGFGFDPLTNDYKVVRSIGYVGELFYTEDGNPEYRGWNAAEVYSLKNQSWTEISAINTSSFKSVRQHHSSRCEMIYWWESDLYNTYLMSFDMKNHVFDSAYFDNPTDRWGGETFWLMKDCIVGVGYCSPSFEIWALLKFDSQRSWTKLFSIPEFSPRLWSYQAVWKHVFYLFETKDGESSGLYGYKPEDGSSFVAEVTNIEEEMDMVAYVPSEISLSGLKING